ncbi:hypothetical protein NO357_20050 [Marimonas arenosa]|uniref:Uncharacterized protein n=2 Tax=Marimonas arenosa TaxID=1795305 RepID=A0AAE3WIP8_9RHOB|nr:hypothetical protein [Marimonas arenosa]
MKLLKPTLVSLALACATAPAVQAAEPVEQHNSNAFWFVNWIGLSNATLTVAEPNGHIVKIYAEDGTPVYQLKGEVQDGVYRYELSAATDKRVKIVNPIDTGREGEQPDTRAVPYYTTGHFVVERGVIITPEEVKEEEG